MVPRIKKTLFHPKADEVLRAEFQAKVSKYAKAGRALVYLDESGFAHDLPRTHGYSKCGERCYGVHDWHAKGRVNVIGAILGKQFLSVCLFQHTIDSDVFFAWLTQDLIPRLPKRSVTVMDNATFHKRMDMREALESNGHTLLYLPPYSPDLNPIEHKWAQAKAIRRRLGYSTFELFACPELC